MFKEDYILRMLQQAVAVFAHIIGLRKTRKYSQALEEIDRLMQGATGLRSSLLNNLDEEGLLGLFRNGERLDANRMALVARLLKEEGEIFNDQNNLAGRDARFLRALNLSLEAALSNELDESLSPADQIGELVQRLGMENLPENTLYPLHIYYEETGKFLASERALQRLMQLSGSPPELRDQAVEFYRRLLSKTDAEIRAAGMERFEIQKSLSECSW